MAKTTSGTIPKTKASLKDALKEYNDTLNTIEQNAKAISEERNKKSQEFQKDFRGHMERTIHPALERIAKEFAVIGNARECTKEDEQKLGIPSNVSLTDYCAYYFQPRNSQSPFIMNIVGNANSQKFFIGFYSYDEKPNIKEFSLKEIGLEQIEKELTKKITELTNKLKKK